MRLGKLGMDDYFHRSGALALWVGLLLLLLSGIGRFHRTSGWSASIWVSPRYTRRSWLLEYREGCLGISLLGCRTPPYISVEEVREILLSFPDQACQTRSSNDVTYDRHALEDSCSRDLGVLLASLTFLHFLSVFYMIEGLVEFWECLGAKHLLFQCSLEVFSFQGQDQLRRLSCECLLLFALLLCPCCIGMVLGLLCCSSLWPFFCFGFICPWCSGDTFCLHVWCLNDLTFWTEDVGWTRYRHEDGGYRLHVFLVQCRLWGFGLFEGLSCFGCVRRVFLLILGTESMWGRLIWPSIWNCFFLFILAFFVFWFWFD